MRDALGAPALEQLFGSARTHSHWSPGAVDDATLARLYDLAKMGPTSANCCPARFVFVRSAQGKARLKPALAAGNVDKTMAAPVTVIVGNDLAFVEKLPQLYPHADAKSWFAGNDALIHETAMRNASLQAGYLILAARSLGLDCGPMSGFDKAAVDATFFAGTTIVSNMLINLGHGDEARLYPRSPRLPFEEACQVL